MIAVRTEELLLIQQRIENMLNELTKFDLKNWVDSNDACKLLNINNKALYYHTINGNIGHSKLGTKRYYLIDELLKFKNTK